MTGTIRKPGAGRKPAPYGKTKQVRVPVACLDAVLAIVATFKEGFKK
jgi:hypothetical protein